MNRNRVRLVVLAVIVSVALGAALLPLMAERGAPREITLVARNMAFQALGEAGENPAIRLAPGESVVLILRNEDPGFIHDFTIPEWQIATRRLRAGESERILVTAPQTPGTTMYICTPHSQMMTGMVIVEPVSVE